MCEGGNEGGREEEVGGSFDGRVGGRGRGSVELGVMIGGWVVVRVNTLGNKKFRVRGGEDVKVGKEG